MTAAATHSILLSNTFTLTNRLLLPTMSAPEGADMRLVKRGSCFVARSRHNPDRNPASQPPRALTRHVLPRSSGSTSELGSVGN
jgi:hypothetical protein